MGFWSKIKDKVFGKKQERVVALISTDGKVISQRPYTPDDEDKDFIRIGNGDLLIERNNSNAHARGRGRSFRTSRVLFQEYYDGLDSGRFSDDLFKDLTPGAFVDTPKETHDRIVKMSLLQYKKNARAFSIVEVVKDFLIGDEIYIDAADPKVQELIDKYWKLNEWDEKLEERVRSLAVTGEQLYPVAVDSEGMLRLASVFPLQIIDVLRNEENAEDIQTIMACVKDRSLDYRTEQVNLTADAEPFTVLKEYDSTRIEEGSLQIERGARPKYCFFFAVNRLAGGTRGQPDLTPVMDWIEGMDSFLFTVLERAELAMQVVFDLKVEGAQKTDLQTFADDFVSNLRAGEAYAHNDKVELNVHSPNIGSSEAQEVYNVLVRMVSAGVGLPGMFFGDSDDVNRASAAEASIPPSKRLQSRQRFVKRLIKRPIDLQIAIAKADGRLKGVTDFRYTVRMPKIMLRDLSMITRAIKGLADALASALDREQPFITAALAHKIFTSALVDLDPSEDFLQAAASSRPEEKKAPELSDLPQELQDAYEEARKARAAMIERASQINSQGDDDGDTFGEG